MSKNVHVYSIALACASLCGCAHDALLRAETRDFTAAVKQTGDQGRAFYDGLIRKDRELWAALYERDPNCTPASLRPSYALDDLSGKGLCTQKRPGTNKVALQDLARSDFSARYDSLRFIDRYLSALSKAADGEDVGAQEEFVAAAADLNLVLTALRKDGVDQGRIDAVAGLVGWLESMAEDRRSAAEIRRLVAENREQVDRLFATLIVELRQDKGHQTTLDGMGLALSLIASESADGSLPAASRRRVIEHHYLGVDLESSISRCERIAKTEVYPEIGLSERDLCGHAESGAMFAAWRSHRAFLELVDGRLDDRQKARLFALHRAEFRRIVGLYLELAGVF